MIKVILLLSCGMAICASQDASAATITKNYTFDLNDIDLTDYRVPPDRYLVSEGDEVQGRIDFAAGQALNFLKYPNATLEFFFEPISYQRVRAEAIVEGLDIDGNSVMKTDYLYSNDNFYQWVSAQSSLNQKATVTSLRYSMKIKSTFGNTNPIQAYLFRFQTSYIDSIASPVPEPSTWAMMILGMAGVGLATRRRRTLSAVAVA